MFSFRWQVTVRSIALFVVLCCLWETVPSACGEDVYREQVTPILIKYCAGCHNDTDREGDLSLASYEGILRGNEDGPVIRPGESRKSRLVEVLQPGADPKMPPEDEPQPTAAEIAILVRWIDAKAPGPIAGDGQDGGIQLALPKVPKIPGLSPTRPITVVQSSPLGRWLAVADFGRVRLVQNHGRQEPITISQLAGKVTALGFTPDASRLLIAHGYPGIGSTVELWELPSMTVAGRYDGQKDVVYAAIVSPDGKRVATAGYDRIVRIWSLDSGQLSHQLANHNGPVFDLAFSPDGELLASASADATVKVWRVDTGERLDTLSQPLKEQYSVAFSPDGRMLASGGADNRIRLWRVVSRRHPAINPLLESRYAHEATIRQLRFTPDGLHLVSLADDGQVKTWSMPGLLPVTQYSVGPTPAQTFAVDVAERAIVVGRLDGKLAQFPLPTIDLSQDVRELSDRTNKPQPDQAEPEMSDSNSRSVSVALQKQTEREPNDVASQATPIDLPADVAGVIAARSSRDDGPDEDHFRFSAVAGESWVVEVVAARDGSLLDSKIRILDERGRPVPRVLLQAVRDSYFTFRGKDSRQTGDFRLHNWEEMRLNQYLYANGEVAKLYHYPRGPDSGFNVYPNFGERFGYFDTTPITHALQEPCYIVVPHPPGTKLPATGLPSIVLPFENDDDSLRRYGADSFLTFTAPRKGDFIIQLRDVRDVGGPDSRYRLRVRPPVPDFRPRLVQQKMKVPRGSGRKFEVRIDRLDGFDGPVAFQFHHLPDGLSVPGQLTIEAGHLRAWGVLMANADVPAPSDEQVQAIQVTATATVKGHSVTHDVEAFPSIELADASPLVVRLVPEKNQGVVESASTTPVIVAQPGETVTATIRVERNGFTDRIAFGNENALVNTPHGVYVDNIGLNGVLIPEGQTERVFFISVEPWVEPTERVVFVEAQAAGNPVSQPVVLRIVKAP